MCVVRKVVVRHDQITGPACDVNAIDAIGQVAVPNSQIVAIRNGPDRFARPRDEFITEVDIVDCDVIDVVQIQSSTGHARHATGAVLNDNIGTRYRRISDQQPAHAVLNPQSI